MRAIGSDLEQTQMRVIASANADMLFHYWKVGVSPKTQLQAYTLKHTIS